MPKTSRRTHAKRYRSGPVIGVRIAVASQLTGLSPAALRRLEERFGLRIPKSAGGHRVFTPSLIEECRQLGLVSRDLIRGQVAVSG